MRQEVALKQVDAVFDTSLLCRVIAITFLGDEVKGFLLGARALSLLKGWSEHLNHIRVLLIIDHQILYLLVTDHIESTQQDHYGNVLFDHWNLSPNRLPFRGS